MRTTLPLALVAIPALHAPLASAAHSETKSYTTGEGLAYIALADTVGCDDVSVGGVCFTPLAGESVVDLAITDASGLPTAANAQVTDASGATIASVIFCDATEIALPPGAAKVHVAMYDSALGLAGCGGLLVGGTTGTIQAVFS